ncbi:MAG: membrane-anchored protein YejM (alkaline phosphatase superfamily) [Gammaproteobacteria bacterium]|jgi:membrane-anchored protein YejM (alkaline phosphatase superfamily)
MDVEASGLGSIYLILQQIGHFQFFSFVVAIPLLLLVLLIPSYRVFWVASLIIFSCFLLIVFGDYAVFKLYRFHLNGMVLNMLLGGAMGEILVLDAANLLTAFAIAGMILLAQTGILRGIRIRYRQKRKGTGWWIFSLVLLIQLSGQVVYGWSDAWYRTDVISQIQYVPFPQAITMKRFLRKQGWAPEIDIYKPSIATKSGRFNYPVAPLKCEASGEKPNLLFIVSDGLRFDMLNDEVMPVWSSLAKIGQRFERHISTGNATRFGIYGLFSGLYGDYWFDSLANSSSPVLVDKLVSEDYRFGFFANARLTSPEFDKALFSSVSDEIPQKTKGEDVIEREYEIVRQAKQFIEADSTDPFFGFLFFDAPHAYVYPPEDEKFLPVVESINYLKLDNQTDPQPFLNRYQNSIAFNDRLTGELLESLKQSGQMDNTIIILTGDHGQEANETRTNSWGHNSNFSRYQIQVPLVIVWPGKTSATYRHLTSHADIVPTLIEDLYECTNDLTDYSNGENLFKPSHRKFVMTRNWNNQAVVGYDVVQTFPKVGVAETRSYLSYEKKDSDYKSGFPLTEVIEHLNRFYH